MPRERRIYQEDVEKAVRLRSEGREWSSIADELAMPRASIMAYVSLAKKGLVLPKRSEAPMEPYPPPGPPSNE